MKLINHDAAAADRRGLCLRNSLMTFLLGLILVFGLMGQAMAQGGGGSNFFFSGYLTFQYEGVTHTVNFEDYGPFGQNVPIPGYFRADNIHSGDSGLFHLSCSDPLIGGLATVVAWEEVAGQPGLSEPPYALGTEVTIIDFDIQRRGPGGGVSVCAPERPEVGKTAVGSFEREFLWKITKTADPTSASIFFGDTQTFGYTVDVDPDGTRDFNYAVSGVITVRNVLEEAITVTAVADVFPGLEGEVDIECTPSLPALLQPAGSDLDAQLTCTYSGASDGSEGTNTATVTYDRGDVTGLQGSASDDFDFSAGPANLVNAAVNVTDSFDGADPAVALGRCSDRAEGCTFTESQTLDCSDIAASVSGDEGTKINIATITETGQSDSARVTLTCYAPTVTKTADPEFTREWFWTIDKSYEGDDPALLMEGTAYELEYTIVVDLDDPATEDRDWAVSGSITVTNPAPIAAVINSVSDTFPGGSEIKVDCGDSDAPYTIDSGESLICSYSGDSNGTDGPNTATAVQANYARAADGSTTGIGTTDYTGTAIFAFVNPTNPVNGCVDVIDLLSIDGIEVDLELLIQAGFDPEDASVCSSEAPATFTYTIEEIWFVEGNSTAEPPICELTVDNEARVVTQDDADVVLASDLVTITLSNEECGPLGCTLTQGYWKTHSAYGPAPYDDNWMNVEPDQEDTIFFLSGQTWYEVFWTPPAGGNVYYSLAHQYMAATLNELNGAAVPEQVKVALDRATELFEDCAPDDFERTRRGRWGQPGGMCEGDRAEAGELASLLDSYNNGNEGVPHCSQNDIGD